MKGRTITKKNMNKYNWANRIFIGTENDWFYYRVPLKETGKYETIKMKGFM